MSQRKKMTTSIKDTLKLIARSRTDGDGWAFCSDTAWPLLVKLPAELHETQLRGFARYVRLTEEAKILLKWM